jgi:hypothetical protein
MNQCRCGFGLQAFLRSWDLAGVGFVYQLGQVIALFIGQNNELNAKAGKPRVILMHHFSAKLHNFPGYQGGIEPDQLSYFRAASRVQEASLKADVMDAGVVFS